MPEKFKNLIDGEWKDSKSGNTFENSEAAITAVEDANGITLF